MWNILQRYLHLYLKLWPWLLAYCVKWTHSTQLTSPISATWQYSGWILHMKLHSYSPSHQRVFCGLVVAIGALNANVWSSISRGRLRFFSFSHSWQDNKTFFEDLVFQQEKIQICTFTFEVNFFGLLCVNGCSYFRPRHRYYLVEKSHICAGSQQISRNDSIKLKTKFKFCSNPRYRLNAYLRQRKLFLSRNRNSGQVV